MSIIVEVERPTQSEGLVRRTSIQQNSEEVDNLAQCIVLQRTPAQDVELELCTNSVNSESVQKPSTKAFPGFMIAITLIQVWVFYWGGNFAFLYLGFDPSRRHEIWRFFTIMFVHSSEYHLWGNMIEQLIFGVFLEIYHWKRVAIIYTAGVLGGTLFVTILEPNIYGEGASAGVYALFFAHLGTIVLNWDKMNYRYCRLLFIFAYIIFGVVLTLRDGKISYAGHFGGAVTGFLISILALKIFVDRSWKKTLKKIYAIILIILTLIIVIINFAFPSMYVESEFNTDYEESYVKIIFERIDIDNNNSSSEAASESPLLIECLKVKDKECGEAWDQYQNTGEVTHANFIHVLSKNFNI